MVYIGSPDGAIEYANRFASEYLGKTLEETRDGACVEPLHSEDRDWVLATCADL
jgi:hypothetical protein